MLSIGDKLREMREELGLTQEEMGAKLGLSGILISRREAGKIRIKPPEMKLWAAVFGMSREEFASKLREDQKVHDREPPRGIPIINRAPAGVVLDYDHDQSAAGEFHGAMAFEDRDKFTQDPELFGLIVVGDSMEPKLIDGDVLIFKNCDGRKNSPELRDGKIVYIRFAKERKHVGNAVYRMYWADEKKKSIRLAKDNPKYAGIVVPLDIDHIARIGCLVQVRRNPENL